VGKGKGSGGGLVEHKFTVLAYDRKTGRLLWEKAARTSKPHQLHHPQYGSFASNSPITDGTRLYAFFGSNGLYCYTLAGDLVWQKGFAPLNMFREVGEGAWTALHSHKLLVLLDQQGDSFLLALDHKPRREFWRLRRPGDTNCGGA